MHDEESFLISLLGLLPTFSNDSGAGLRRILGLTVLYLDSPGQLLVCSIDSENNVSESFLSSEDL